MSQCHGLRIVHDEDVVVFRKHLRAHPVAFQVGPFGFWREVELASLQCIMEALGNGEEVFIAVDQTPVDFNSERKMDRDESAQQLRNSAASCGGVYLTNPQPLRTFA